MQVKFLRIREKYRILDKSDQTTQFAFKCTFEISDKHAVDLRRVRVPLPDSCVGLKNESIRCYKSSDEAVEKFKDPTKLELTCQGSPEATYDAMVISMNGVVTEPMLFDCTLVFLMVFNSWPPMNHPATIKFTLNEQTLAEIPEIQSDQPIQRVNRLEKQFISTSAGMGMLGGGGSANAIIVNHQDYERNKANYYQIKIVQSESNRLEIYIFKSATLKQLKDEISRKTQILSQESQATWEHFPTENQRLVSQGRELTDNNILLKDIPRMANAPGGVFNMSRQQANAQRQQVNLPALQLSEVAQHLNRVRTLQRNFHACVKGAQLNRDANQRDRFDEPETPTPAEPTVADLGDFAENLSNSMLLWSHQLEDMGNFLRQDSPLPNDRQSAEFQKARQLIQNNMDACRYIAHELTAFSKFVIPLARNPPRRLNVIRR